MNYRHAYHAGNFCDVLKHATLALVIEHLKQKPAPFRVIDTHAGTGLYDLTSETAQKTGEWRQGIGRLAGNDATPIPEPAASLLAPFLAAVAAHNSGGRLSAYPGSPRIARHLMRPQDRLVVNELHPDDGVRLSELFARDRQVKVLRLDGWTALKALLPPKERRGVILIDPPFEERGELDRLAQGLRAALARFATGIYLLWYPIKDQAPIARFHRALAALPLQKAVVGELMIRQPRDSALNGTGLAIVNPPWHLGEALQRLLPFLSGRLGENDASYRLSWLAGCP